MEKQGEKIKLKTALALAIIQNKTPGLLFKDYIKDAILESADPSEYWRMRYNAANKELFKLKSRLFDLEMQNNELPEQPERNKEVINRIDLDFRGCIKQDVSMGKKLVPNGLKYSIGNLLNDTYKYLPFNHLFQSSMVIIETIENHLENKDPVSQPYFELLLFCLLKYITMSSRLDYKMKENLFGKFLSWIRISCGSHSICYSMDIHSDCTIPESLLSLCLKLTQTTLEFRVRAISVLFRSIMNSFSEYEELRKTLSHSCFSEVFMKLELIVECLTYYSLLMHNVLNLADLEVPQRYERWIKDLILKNEGKTIELICSGDSRIKKVGLDLVWIYSQALTFLDKSTGLAKST